MTDEMAAHAGGVLVIFVRGLAALAAVAVFSLLAVMAVDAGVTLFSVTVRYALTLAALALTLLAAGALFIRPLARSFTLNGIARGCRSASVRPWSF